MHLRVAVGATAGDHVDRSAAAATGQRVGRARHRRVAGRAVALLAQQRRRLGQQRRAHRAMRRVAQRSSLRPPARVPTAAARASRRGSCSRSGSASAWRSIAGAVEPGALWHPLQVIRPNRTGCVEGFWKSARCSLWQAEHTSASVVLASTGGALALVELVAVGAGDLVAFVRAGAPARSRGALVAGQAGLVARSSETFESALKLLIAAPSVARVQGAGPVAGLALQAAGAERRALVAAVAVLGLEDRCGRVGGALVVMAAEAGVGSLGAVLVGPGQRCGRRRSGALACAAAALGCCASTVGCHARPASNHNV